MFEGFERVRIDTGEATISTVHGGSGPPVLLVHGFPETSAMWAGIAPALAETHTVIAVHLDYDDRDGSPYYEVKLLCNEEDLAGAPLAVRRAADGPS